MDRGAWQATVHGVANSWTQLSDYLTTIVLLFMQTSMPSHMLIKQDKILAEWNKEQDGFRN